MAQIQSLRPPKIFAGLLHKDAGQEYQGNQVGNGHQSVHDVRKVPHHVQGQHRSDEGADYEQKPVDDDNPFPSEVFYGFFSVVGPS